MRIKIGDVVKIKPGNTLMSGYTGEAVVTRIDKDYEDSEYSGVHAMYVGDNGLFSFEALSYQLHVVRKPKDAV